MKEDWRELGNDIRSIVQEAVNSQDFRRLNQNIRNTINDAVDSVAEGFWKSSTRTEYGQTGYRQGRETGHDRKRDRKSVV